MPPFMFPINSSLCDIAIISEAISESHSISTTISLLSIFLRFIINPSFSQIYRFYRKYWFYRKTPHLCHFSPYRKFITLSLSQTHAYNGSYPFVPWQRDIASARPPSNHPAHPMVYITSHPIYSLYPFRYRS